MEIYKSSTLKCLICKEHKDLNIIIKKDTKVICADCIASMSGILLQNAELEAIKNSQYFRQPIVTDWKITNDFRIT